MSDRPHIDGVLSAEEVARTAAHLSGLQLADGMIPWFPGGHCDPWNHVESAMALDVAGHHDEAARAYQWLVDTQRADGSWHNYYGSDGAVTDPKLDTNVCAYIATGVWHHWCATGRRDDLERFWPAVDRALDWVLSMRRPDGLPVWARQPDSCPWEYALLTGSSSVQHALGSGVRLAEVLGVDRSRWAEAQHRIVEHIRTDPDVFEPKDPWAMDWYYPVLTGALRGPQAARRLAERRTSFVMGDFGVRCVSTEPWVTASETAECAIAYAVAGEVATATDLLATTRRHRRPDGSYWTGIVYPDEVLFPDQEHTSYTAAAVLLAADVITRATPAAFVF